MEVVNMSEMNFAYFDYIIIIIIISQIFWKIVAMVSVVVCNSLNLNQCTSTFFR